MATLVTGMSGVGKSTVAAAVRRRGFRAYDLDLDGWSGWARCEGDPTGAKEGYDWVWNEDRVRALLDAPADGELFLFGCAPNMAVFRHRFRRLILLSAPLDVLLKRVSCRAGNAYGKRPEEAARIAANLRETEPLLRKMCTEKVDASRPLDAVVHAVVGRRA